MRNAVFTLLRWFKWRLIVPAAWRLGLPHQRIAARFRLAPLVDRLRAARAMPRRNEGSVADLERRYPAAVQGSIHSSAVVSQVCQVLQETMGGEAVERYVEALIADAPQYEPDIRLGHLQSGLESDRSVVVARARALLQAIPLQRTGRSMLQVLSQAGDIRLAGEIAEQVAEQDSSVRATLPSYRARRRLLEHGYHLPTRTAEPRYRPRSGRTFYLVHNAVPLDSGGYAIRTHGLVRSLRRQGWDVECVSRFGYPGDVKSAAGWVPPLERVDGVPYHRLVDPARSYRTVDPERYLTLNAEAVLRLARQRRPALIHGASNHINGLAAAYVGRRLGLPSVYEVRGLWELTRLSRQPAFAGSESFEMIVKLETQACHAVDRVVTITDALKALLVARGVPAGKITVVPNGVDVAACASGRRDGTDVRRQLGLPADATVLGYVGSMPQYEGLDDLIDAVVRLEPSIRSSVYCLLVGDGDQFDHLQEKARRAGLAEQILFAGRVPHRVVSRYYDAIDVMVFPRKPQPVTEIVSPIKPFEAMALMKPIIASDVGALKEIVDDGETGLLFRKGDTDDLACCIARLAGDAELRRRVGQAGHDWVHRRRDWAVLTPPLGRIYQSLVQDHRTHRSRFGVEGAAEASATTA